MTEKLEHILDCSKCPYVGTLKQNVADISKDIDEVEKALCEKISFHTFKWIIGALCMAALLVFGWNSSELKNLSVKMDYMSDKMVNMTTEIVVIKKHLEKN